MSKLRDNVQLIDGDLQSPAEGDIAAYVIFTRLTETSPHLYAGWLDAIDETMALQFAREHYGQDQKCVGLWAIPRSAISGTEARYRPSSTKGRVRDFEVFFQPRAGDQHVWVGSVQAPSPDGALRAAQEQFDSDGANCIWVVPRDRIATTHKDDLIWRYTSQDYRMARGYAADVRRKWQKIRAERDLKEYEKDDLKETF